MSYNPKKLAARKVEKYAEYCADKLKGQTKPTPQMVKRLAKLNAEAMLVKLADLSGEDRERACWTIKNLEAQMRDNA